MKKLLIPILLLIAACGSQQPADELSRWQQRAANVEIYRDDYGVPHIYGKTDADAVFGLLYAQCEDDFNRVERNYIWAIGRLAEVEGEKMLYSDLRARLYMTREEAIAAYESSPPWLKELCVAFADGINYYLYTHPQVKPKLLTHFEPWMPMYFSEGSIGGDIERVSTVGIRDFYEEKSTLAQRTPVADDLPALADDEPRGSNGIALSGKLTRSGKAMLLINPHTSFYFRGEVHVVSEEGLNAYGAVTWGQFFVYQGFNEKTGWMHTSSYIDVIDEFVETVRQGKQGLQYKYGDEWRPLTVKEVTLAYKEGDSLKRRKFPIYRTHHGPITHKQGDKWVATALMWQPVKALEQSFVRTKQSGYEGFRQMMDIRANSSNNTVYADADGNIAYFHGNFIPKRDPRFDYSKPVDGSNPATDWQGLHTVDECITVLNPPNGWIQNCNSTPFTSAAEYSPRPQDYPPYMRLPGENFRAIHAIRLLQKADDMTLDKLITLAYDPYLTAFEVLIPGLIEAYDNTPGADPTLQAPIDVLRNWDFAVSKESVAMSLAHFYGWLYRREGQAPDTLSRMQQIEWFASRSPYEERLRIFRQAINKLTADFGTWQTPWGEINRFQRLTGDIIQPFDDSKPSLPVGMASGRWGALASFGAKAYNTKRLYGTSGNSFVAVVEFGDKVKAKTLLAGGQSGHPESPHFNDQVAPYINVQFKEAAYYRDEVEARAQVKYHPGEQIDWWRK